MNFTTTYVLYAILLALILVLAVVLWVGPGTTDTSSFVFPSLNGKSAAAEWQKFDRIEIDQDGKKLSFVRDKNTWTVNGFLANAGVVNEMVRSIVNSRRDKNVGR